MPRIAKWVAAAVIALVVAVKPAAAQLEAGDRSIAVQGLLMTSGGGEDGFTMGLGLLAYNYYKTKNLAIRSNIIATSSASGDEDAETTIALGVGAEWNFTRATESKSIPFAALDVLYITGPDDLAAVGLSPSVGVRTFISRSASFDVVGAYNMYSQDGDTAGIFAIRLGLSFYLGKDARR